MPRQYSFSRRGGRHQSAAQFSRLRPFSTQEAYHKFFFSKSITRLYKNLHEIAICYYKNIARNRELCNRQLARNHELCKRQLAPNHDLCFLLFLFTRFHEISKLNKKGSSLRPPRRNPLHKAHYSWDCGSSPSSPQRQAWLFTGSVHPRTMAETFGLTRDL